MLPITNLVKKMQDDDVEQNSMYHRVTLILVQFCFALNHWIFTWHYFEAACLFKLCFGDHDISSLNYINRRKQILKVVNIVAWTIMIVFCVVMTSIAVMSDLLMSNYS